MNNTLRLTYFVFLLLLASYITALPGDKPPKLSSSVEQYHATMKEGLIGATIESPVDNPADNIFHVQVNEPLCGNESVWLVYELNGVEDHSNVSRSINDQLATGGYFVKKREGWKTQRERVDVSWLKSGDNVIRFTLPENAKHSYRIRNLSVEIEKHDESTEATRKLVIDQLSASVYGGYVYLKGFVTGEGNNHAKIKVDGNDVRMFNGEFESITLASHPLTAGEISDVKLEVIYPDGFSLCEQVEVTKAGQVDFQYLWKKGLNHREKIFTPREAGSISLAGAMLNAPAGSLDKTSFLSITTLRDVDIPALDAGMVNVTRDHDGYRFLPHGTKFNKEVTLILPYDPEKIPEGYTEKDIRTYYFDEESHHWVPVSLDTISLTPTLSHGEGSMGLGMLNVPRAPHFLKVDVTSPLSFDQGPGVRSRTTHFTDFINAIIKVPESPEVNAYNSTSMKGIKAANPTAAVNLINPPQANNTGSAALSYPLNIPAGRNGMQPQLAISYTSGGGNGWLGVGWNLTIPAITIDTRWGAPRYDAQTETETYTMNGEQLSPVAHRDVVQNRDQNGSKQFFPRVEGSFHRIIRHGTTPKNYWWEVTDKNGTKYIYGATGGSADENSTLSDDTGNKGFWALREVRDLNGNYVLYNYAKVENTGLAEGSVKGYQLYVDDITYTHHSSGQGPYMIKFIRETGRPDVMISANLGFKMVTADLLNKIEVTYNNVPIRHYELNYIPGAFHKTLLSSIREYDAAGNLFTTHEFNYYDDVGYKEGYKPFSNSQQWTARKDDVNANFKNPIKNIDPLKDFGDEATALSGTKSKDRTTGMTVTVGLGFANFACKSLSAGGSYGETKSESEGLLTMLDINGDGLSDKIVLKGNNMYYRENQSGPDGSFVFSDVLKEVEGPVSSFYKEKSKTKTWGFEAHAGCKAVSAFAGKGWNKTTSKTSVYFTDVNGDQLPDLVKNGIVYFNRIDPNTGKVKFAATTEGTPSEIGDSSMDPDLITVNQDEINAIKAENPLHDVVRVWQAPYTGTVNIIAPVRLMNIEDEDRSESPVDGVRVAIQVRGNQIWTLNIGPNDYSEHDVKLDNIPVQKGDRIYFRVGSIDNGSYDLVKWAPVIKYANAELNYRDANNKPVNHYSIENDFLVNSTQYVSPPINGKATIRTEFEKPVTSDAILAKVFSINHKGDSVKIFEENFKWDTVLTKTFEKNIEVDTTQNYYFQVLSSSNIDWTAIKFDPYIFYTESHDATYPNVKDKDGNPLLEFYPVTEYSLYPKEIFQSKPWSTQKDTAVLTIKPKIELRDLPLWEKVFANGRIFLSLKKRGELLWKDTVVVKMGELVTDISQIVFKDTVYKSDEYFIEYHLFDEPTFSDEDANKDKVTINDALLALRAQLQEDDDSPVTYQPGVFSENFDKRFGLLYRGWGQFIWNANDKVDVRMDENLMKLNSKVENPGNPDVDNAYDPSKDQFLIMAAMAKNKVWAGYDTLTFLTSTLISSSRLGEKDIEGLTGSGARGIDKVSKSEGSSFSAGAGVDFGGLGGSFNRSKGTSKVVTDFMDINGDRYPDIVTDQKIQVTDARGILSEVLNLSDILPPGDGHYNHQTYTESDGLSISGSFATSLVRNGTKDMKKNATDVGHARAGGGISGNFAKGDNHADFTYMDINGDGLPDRVYRGGEVALNFGYKFSEKEKWGHSEIQSGGSKSYGSGLSVNIGNGSQSASFSAGVSLARSDNFTDAALQDVNGDGLPDRVSLEGNSVKVKLNTGNGFSSEVIEWKGASAINDNATASEALNVSFTFSIPISVTPPIKLQFNPSHSRGKSISREKSRFGDIDGDGFLDYLHSTKDDNLTVSRSTIARTNMLKEVKRPLGGSFTMDYERVGNTYDLPNSTWVLNSVEVFDGFAGDGVDKMKTTFAYEGGKYDRHERENYGFSKVITRTHDTSKDDAPVYTIVTQTFKNDNYYEKGLLLNEVMTDENGNKWVEKENVYALKNVEGTSNSEVAFPALTETSQKFYEGQAEAGKSTHMTYGYDARGNVVNYANFGDEGSDDDLSAVTDYHAIEDKYIIGTPKEIKVTGSGKVIRRRESKIDANTGDVVQIKQFLESGEAAVHDLEYDQYGNLSKITRPANSNGERLSIEYEYDNTVHTYTTKVSNSYGYSSEAVYDFKFGQMLKSIDLNGNEISYEIDDKGRVIQITGPYEKGGYTIKFDYFPDAEVPWARTQHYDPANPGNDMETAIFVDGLGRVLQTKKDIALYEGENKLDKEAMVVSGRVLFDAFGRTTKAWYPVTEEKGQIEVTGKLNPNFDDVDPTESAYDVLNRTLTVTLPDKSVTKTEYGFESDNKGKKQFSTKTTDANGKQTEQFTDVRGRVTAVKNYTSEKDIWTSFVYNAINEQVEATDDLGHTTFSTYDNFGRRVSRKHPDAGTTTYTYDLAGNLTQLTTANLSKEGGVIEYKYDRERLTEIIYPQNPENNVKYSYGEASAAHNRAGRIVIQEDATGAQEFFYGPLGEVVKNIRTVIIPHFDEQTFVTEWTYDTWNRLTAMTYADGEKVDYTYNVGGLLHSMSGKKKGDNYDYVKQLGYDKFEQRVFLAYGNGTKTTYEYEPDRRRLKHMTAQTSAQRLFMDNAYEYDKVNNILSLKNNAVIPASNLMGGSSEYNYSYDDLYRLTEATGSFKGSNEEHRYNLAMSYNSVGGILQKTQKHERSGGGGGSFVEQKKTTYDQSYTYSEEQPHAPIHIGRQAFTYDANGNQTGWTDDISGQRRKIMWDEENRIRAIYDNGALYHYVYDASGERVLKGQGQGQRVFVNGEQKAGSGQVGNYTVYVNPYLVLKSGGYTKHYYIEGQRIVSKLGGGWDNDGKGPLKAGGDKIDYNGKSQKVFDGLVKNLKFLGADGQILTAGKSGKIPPGQLNGQGGGGGTSTSESFRYFYHPDHLGSTSYITDASGEVYQHLEYFAFGETFVEEHSNTDRTPYLFNGKELDEETGLYYYGARYYESQISVMLSVDRFTEKYPGLTPYHYGANNPIKYVDINGDSIINGSQREMQAIATDLNKIYKDKYGVDNAFSVVEKVETEKVQTNKVTLDPRTWGNLFEEAKYEEKTTTTYALAANKDFNWKTDKYTSAMHDLISMKGKIYLDIVADRGSGLLPLESQGFLKDYGGGYTKNSHWVILSNKLSTSDGTNKSSKWTIGGVAMHELLYHVHPVGKTEGGDPNIMRNFYNMRTGKKHPEGSQHLRFK